MYNILCIIIHYIKHISVHTLMFKFPLDSISCSPRSFSWPCNTILRTLKFVSVTFCPLGSSVLCDTFKWTLAFSFFTNFLFPDLTIVIHNNSTQIKTKLTSKQIRTRQEPGVQIQHVNTETSETERDWRVITTIKDNNIILNRANTRRYSANHERMKN